MPVCAGAGVIRENKGDAVRLTILKVCDSGTCTYWHLTYIRPEYIDPSVEFIVNAFTQGGEGESPIENGTISAI